MLILYIGDDQPLSTSGHRAAALVRLGHEVLALNPRLGLPQGRIFGGLSTRLGFWPFTPWINASLRRRISSTIFDLAWIDTGAELSPGFHRWLRRRGMKVVNCNVDDPFSVRDGHKWDLYRRSVCLHDLTVVVRKENIAEAKAVGAQNVRHVFRSYDPVAHAPVAMNEAELSQWSNDVVFVGSWMPERGPFMESLLKAGVRLAIRGDHWQKAPEYERLRPSILGPAVYGTDYVKAIQGAKVALGLLSKGNRDLHTTRSAEVPFIGGAVFCAERTPEHEAMFRDDVEAALWSTPDECARKCLRLLREPEARVAMAKAARARVIELGISNDETIAWILDSLLASGAETVRPLPPFQSL